MTNTPNAASSPVNETPATSDAGASPVKQPEPETTLLKWQAPSRLFKRRDREYFTTIGVLVILLSVILVFAKEFLLVGVVMALAFVAYALASVPPEIVEHTISNKGMRTGGKLYEWEQFGRFWFEEKWKQRMVVVEHLNGFPGQLTLLLSDELTNDRIEDIIGRYLINEKPLPTVLDKAANWLQEKVPLESETT